MSNRYTDLGHAMRMIQCNEMVHSHLEAEMTQVIESNLHEIDRLKEELGYIAKQNLSTEMDEQTNEDADFEGGYDRIIEIARKAIQTS